MSRSKTSKAWMREHVNDPYVQAAKAEGYRSRAAYKLMEIDREDKLFAPGMLVVDLGAAPGQLVAGGGGAGWARGPVDRARSAADGRRCPACDFIQGDFREEEVLDALAGRPGRKQGRPCIIRHGPQYLWDRLGDQARAMHLAELALEFAAQS